MSENLARFLDLAADADAFENVEGGQMQMLDLVVRNKLGPRIGITELAPGNLHDVAHAPALVSSTRAGIHDVPAFLRLGLCPVNSGHSSCGGSRVLILPVAGHP